MRDRTTIPLLLALAFAVALASCAQPALKPEPAPPVPAPAAEPTPLRFNIGSGMNDTWNAVGQILVRTPGVSFDGRAQMLGLNAIRYRGEPLMLLTRALPLSDSITTLTTEVTVTTTSGTALHSEGAAELLALLARELPAEVDSVKARLAAEKKAKESAKSRRRKTSGK